MTDEMASTDVFRSLLASIRDLGSAALASEAAACEAVVALRFPRGISCACGGACTRELARVTCTRCARVFTVLVGTPLHTKRRPRIRALLLAIRAFALSTTSISARQLARDVDAPPNTIWRHLITLRALLPAQACNGAHAVQVCGRSTDAEPAWVHVDETIVAARERALLTGTFRGVSARFLAAYLDEGRARAACALGARGQLLPSLLAPLVSSGAALTFRAVRDALRARST